MDLLFERVKRTFRDYDTPTLERLHAGYYEIYRSILSDEGDDQFYKPRSGRQQCLLAELCRRFTRLIC